MPSFISTMYLFIFPAEPNREPVSKHLISLSSYQIFVGSQVTFPKVKCVMWIYGNPLYTAVTPQLPWPRHPHQTQWHLAVRIWCWAQIREGKKGANHNTFYPISSHTPIVSNGMQGENIQTSVSINFNLLKMSTFYIFL